MKQVTAKEVETLLNEGKQINLIDVREADEVASGKIPGVIHIPLGFIEYRMHELDQAKEYIIVCRSGARSAAATSFLEGQGYNVTNMLGGMIAWQGKVE